MGLPIAAVQVGISDGIATVEHPAIPHIQATVGHAVGVGGGVGVFEKYQVAGPWGAGSGAVVVKPLRPQPPDVPAALVQHIGQVAGAVKGCAWAVAAPNIGITDVFFCLGGQGGKGGIGQVRLRHVMESGAARVSVR